ncbi:MAG: hypothetical protein R2711_19145 [Acidimicrobiales bacterium]
MAMLAAVGHPATTATFPTADDLAAATDALAPLPPGTGVMGGPAATPARRPRAPGHRPAPRPLRVRWPPAPAAPAQPRAPLLVVDARARRERLATRPR